MILERFKENGITAIPLRENFFDKQIPGPVELLTQVAEGKLTVDYVKLRHKWLNPWEEEFSLIFSLKKII